MSKNYDSNFFQKKVLFDFQSKLQQELYIWEEIENERIIDKIRKNLDESEFDNYHHQHHFFDSQNGIQRLIMFLLGRSANLNAGLKIIISK